MQGNCRPMMKFDEDRKLLIVTNDQDDFYYFGFESREDIDEFVQFMIEIRDAKFPINDPVHHLNEAFRGKMVNVQNPRGGKLAGVFQTAKMVGGFLSVDLGPNPKNVMTILQIRPEDITEYQLEEAE